MDVSRETVRQWRNGGDVPFVAGLRQVLLDLLLIDWEGYAIDVEGKSLLELAVMGGLEDDPAFVDWL